MRGAALLTAVVTSFIAAVQPARTATQQGTKAGHEAKRCGILAKASADYRIKARKLTCRFAKKWSRAYLNSRSAAPGFDCYRASTNVTFYCANGVKAYWAERLTATAANHPGHGPVRVDVGDGAFKPPDVRIGTGDTVLWVWSGPDLDHTVSAGPGQAEQFDSDPSGTPNHKLDDSFAHRFANTGTYSYFCRRHPDQMKGTIRVVRLQGLGDTTRPRLTRVRVGPNGRRIAFRLTEGAIVLARIQRRTRSGWRSARNFDVFARKGRNRARLPLRGLVPGRYRVRLTAYDDADNASRPAFARLRI
jgi:plastocyanin